MFIVWKQIIFCVVIQVLLRGATPEDLVQFITKENSTNNFTSPAYEITRTSSNTTPRYELITPSSTTTPGNEITIPSSTPHSENDVSTILSETRQTEADPSEEEEEEDDDDEDDENDWNRQEPKPTESSGSLTTISQLTQSTVQETTTPANEIFEQEKRYYKMPSQVRPGDTAPGYHLGQITQDIKSQPMYMFLTISLPIAICGIMLALFCIFGLKPDGYLCNRIFSPECEVLVQKI